MQQSVEIVVAIRGSDAGVVTRTGAGQQQRNQPVSGTIWLVPIGVGDETIVITAPIAQALHLYLPTRQFNLLAGAVQSRALARSFHPVSGRTDR
ncbi:MAG: hypothetical protein WDN69_23925 [Aliidongia sp.]